MLSLALPEIYTEHNIWINGRLFGGNRHPTGHPLAYNKPAVLDFHAEASVIEIVLQVRNTAHVFAGISDSVLLGSVSRIHRGQSFRVAADQLLTFICLMAGIFSLVIFFFFVKSIEFIHFSILCLAASLRGLLSNEVLLMELFPELSFIIGSRLVTLSIPLIVIATLLYTFALYREDIPNLIGETLLAINILYAIMILFADSFVYASFLLPYLVSVAAACLLGLFITIRILVRRRIDAGYYLIGIMLLAAGATNDVLKFLQVINTRYLLTAAVALFVVSQAFLLVNRVASMQLATTKLSTDLRHSNTRALQTETAFLNVQIKPHFLYNALNTIAEFCRTDPAEAEQLILSLSRYLRGTLDFDNLGDEVTIRKELDLIKAYVSIEMARFCNFDIEYNIEPELLDRKLPPLILQPLVENAIKHGVRGLDSRGVIQVHIHREGNNIRCCVMDNGKGIPDERRPDLLRANSGTGVGLYNIHTRLIRLYGRGLEISSKPGAGTRICFIILKGE